MAHILERNDIINALPDELLVCILSFLSLKEAVATSIICRRWRNLWTFREKLDLDGIEFFRRVWSTSSKDSEEFDVYDFAVKVLCAGAGKLEESWNYIAWVDNILGFHKCSNIKEFRVDFVLTKAHTQHISRWLRFASASKVERLDLNLRWERVQQYAWPSDLSNNFKHLRSMRVHGVDLCGVDVTVLLRTCLLLEELCVCFSRNLVSVKIMGGPSLALKRLEINRCYGLKCVEIRDAINLVYLKYNGKKLKQFVLKNVPLLDEMHLGGDVLRCMKDFGLMFSSYLSLLKKLTIDTYYTSYFDNKEAGMLKMNNLEQLVFKFKRKWYFKLRPVTYLIRASPLLQSFVLEAYGGYHMIEERSFFFEDPSKKKGEGWYDHDHGHGYPHLRRVELVGYRGTLSEQELAVHLLQNVSALEEFIVDLRKRDNLWAHSSSILPNTISHELPVGYHSIGKDYHSVEEDEYVKAIKAHVKDQLTARLPSTLQHLHLKIL